MFRVICTAVKMVPGLTPEGTREFRVEFESADNRETVKLILTTAVNDYDVGESYILNMEDSL